MTKNEFMDTTRDFLEDVAAHHWSGLTGYGYTVKQAAKMFEEMVDSLIEQVAEDERQALWEDGDFHREALRGER